MHKGVRINIPRLPSSEVGHREVKVIETLIDGVCEAVRDISQGADISVNLAAVPDNINQKRKAVISLSQEYKDGVENKIGGKQDKLVPGENIRIVGNEISAKDTIFDDSELREKIRVKWNEVQGKIWVETLIEAIEAGFFKFKGILSENPPLNNERDTMFSNGALWVVKGMPAGMPNLTAGEFWNCYELQNGVWSAAPTKTYGIPQNGLSPDVKESIGHLWVNRNNDEAYYRFDFSWKEFNTNIDLSDVWRAIDVKADRQHTHTKANITDFTHTHSATDGGNIPITNTTGNIPFNRLPTGTGAEQVAIGSHTHTTFAPTNIALTAETGTGTNTDTPPVASGAIQSVVQSVWSKIRQTSNAISGRVLKVGDTMTGPLKNNRGLGSSEMADSSFRTENPLGATFFGSVTNACLPQIQLVGKNEQGHVGTAFGVVDISFSDVVIMTRSGVRHSLKDKANIADIPTQFNLGGDVSGTTANASVAQMGLQASSSPTGNRTTQQFLEWLHSIGMSPNSKTKFLWTSWSWANHGTVAVGNISFRVASSIIEVSGNSNNLGNSNGWSVAMIKVHSPDGLFIFRGERGADSAGQMTAVWQRIANAAELSAYLPLAGGTVLGHLTVGNNLNVQGTTNLNGGWVDISANTSVWSWGGNRTVINQQGQWAGQIRAALGFGTAGYLMVDASGSTTVMPAAEPPAHVISVTPASGVWSNVLTATALTGRRIIIGRRNGANATTYLNTIIPNLIAINSGQQQLLMDLVRIRSLQIQMGSWAYVLEILGTGNPNGFPGITTFTVSLS